MPAADWGRYSRDHALREYSRALRPGRASDGLPARLPSGPTQAATPAPKASKPAAPLPVTAPTIRKAALPADAVSGVPAVVNTLPKQPVGLVPPRVTFPKDVT